jgi:uncharacterized membrane protein (UPF0127 family)
MPPAQAHFLSPLMKKGAEAGAALVVRETGTALATTVEVAFESEARKRGLLGRASLDPGHALIIAPCSAVHTFGMQFAIDVVFVAKNGKILKITREMGPGRVTASLRAFATIEFRAGTVEAIGVSAGQHVDVR